jgi:hypothetical protein
MGHTCIDHAQQRVLGFVLVLEHEVRDVYEVDDAEVLVFQADLGDLDGEVLGLIMILVLLLRLLVLVHLHHLKPQILPQSSVHLQNVLNGHAILQGITVHFGVV